jgi:hypothetical protein
MRFAFVRCVALVLLLVHSTVSTQSRSRLKYVE